MAFDNSTDYALDEIKIDGLEVSGLLFSLKWHEDIRLQAIMGSVILVDNVETKALFERGIDGTEDISFDLRDGLGNHYRFEGKLNKIKNRVQSGGSNSTVELEFSTTMVRENEKTFITRKYKAPSEDVVRDLMSRMGQELDKIALKTLPITFISPRWRPSNILKYLAKYSVPVDANSNSPDPRTGGDHQSEGLAGAFVWQTKNGVRACSGQQLLSGEGGNVVETPLRNVFGKRSYPLEERMHHLVSYELPKQNDLQTQLRGGAYSSKLICFDIGSGIYSEKVFQQDDFLTEKQQKEADVPTRVMWRAYNNESYEGGCVAANIFAHDTSPLSLQQSNARMSTLMERVTEFTLGNRLDLCAGDVIEVIISTVVSEDTPERYNPQVSGKYVIASVGHHLFVESQTMYTKLVCIRSSHQQDDPSSQTPI